MANYMIPDCPGSEWSSYQEKDRVGSRVRRYDGSLVNLRRMGGGEGWTYGFA